MVGVPGKSKGCITCKKRRIKCDETKPTCKRCTKSGYICAGYQTALHFVNASTAPFQSHILTSSSSSSAIPYLHNQAHPVKVAPRIRTTSIPLGISLVAFQSDVCISYMLHNFVWRTFGVGWLESAAAKKLDETSAQAVGALSRIFFGIEHQLEDVQLKGSVQYGKALSLLRPALEDIRKPGVEYLIVPILIMLMHASYEEDQTAAVAHLKGLIMLLHVAGPSKFQIDPVKKAFESARAPLAISHLVARQPLFLSQPQWKTVPWALDPPSKSQQNLLTDILVNIPGYLAEDLKLQQHNDAIAHDALLEKVKESLYALHCWRYTWEILYPNAAWETIPIVEAAKPRVVPRKLHFATHERAADILLYNAIHMWLIGLILRLDRNPFPLLTLSATAHSAAHATGFATTSPYNPLHLPTSVHSLRDPAIEICRAFEFQMEKPESNRDSSVFFLFPLGIAWPVLEGEGDFRDWMRGMLDRTSVTSGYAIGRNKWFGKYYLPKVMGRGRVEVVL